jgi:hypothetical protein
MRNIVLRVRDVFLVVHFEVLMVPRHAMMGSDGGELVKADHSRLELGDLVSPQVRAATLASARRQTDLSPASQVRAKLCARTGCSRLNPADII